MSLLNQYIISEAEELHTMRVRVTFVGGRSALPKQLQQVMQQLEERTATNDGMHLQIAINYGGRDEIVRAVQKLGEEIATGAVLPKDITGETVSRYLDTAGTPDPDLVIRTSGEMRLSGFMPWQASASELVFVDTLWPDFTVKHLTAALYEYSKRQRRHGGVVPQSVAK